MLFLCLHAVQVSCPPLQRPSLFSLLLTCFHLNILIFLVYFSHRHASAFFYSTYPKVGIYSELICKATKYFLLQILSQTRPKPRTLCQYSPTTDLSMQIQRTVAPAVYNIIVISNQLGFFQIKIDEVQLSQKFGCPRLLGKDLL